MVTDLLDNHVTPYSSLDSSQTKTNAAFKSRQEVVTTREKNQLIKITELRQRYLNVLESLIPELKRKDAANQAIYDNLGTFTPFTFED